MVLLVGQSEAICPLPKHLKHFMFLVLVLDDDVELCLAVYGNFICYALNSNSENQEVFLSKKEKGSQIQQVAEPE